MSQFFQPNIPYTQLADYCRRNQIAYLALFGSAVRGELRADSDIDLLVEFAPGARIGFLALGRMQSELAALCGRPVDLAPLIRQEVLQSARVLYAE